MHVHLDGLKLFAYHGVLPQENRVGANYTIDLLIKTDFSEAAQTDDLTHTVNYAELYQAVKEEMSIPSKLLEHVSYRIGQRILTDFASVEEVKIAIYKENPPMEAECKNVGIEATYLR